MKEPTIDSKIFIIDKYEDVVIYETIDGEKWKITGTCIACGECEVNANDVYFEENDNEKVLQKKNYQIWTNVEIGKPNACLDTRFGKRLDIPVRPELSAKFSNCTLKGEYLNGN